MQKIFLQIFINENKQILPLLWHQRSKVFLLPNPDQGNQRGWGNQGDGGNQGGERLIKVIVGCWRHVEVVLELETGVSW